MRHAKSSWDEPDLPDDARPLKKRGKNDARIMGKVLNKHGIQPDQILSSPAKRAFETALLIAVELDYGKPVEKNTLLYSEGVEQIFTVIRTLNETTATALLFGHNPEFTLFVNLFSKTGIENLPTCGIAGITFNVKRWTDVQSVHGKLLFLDFPKRHR